MKKTFNIAASFQTRNYSFRFCLLMLTAFFLLTGVSFAQTKNLIKRTTYKTEKMDFGMGGTVTIVGAPTGSITIEGWQQNEIEVSADIEVQAENEADLAQLAQITGFLLDQDFGHVRIVSLGTQDKNYLKRVAKKFPKKLIGLPFKIDYRIKVPVYSDLEINGGHGDLTLSKVEGAMQINVIQGDADLTLTGGTIIAVFGGGNININVASRSWRGRRADFQLALGNLNVKMLPNSNADIDASILRTGKIENSITALKPRTSGAKFTEKSMLARAGNGGAVFSFTVGDGTMKFSN